MEMMESKGSNSTEEVTYVFTPGRVSVIGNPATSKETILKLLGHPDANKPSTEGKPMYLYGKMVNTSANICIIPTLTVICGIH